MRFLSFKHKIGGIVGLLMDRGAGRDGQAERSAENERYINALYALLYNAVHDFDQSLDLASTATKKRFGIQWETLKAGSFLLSDPWFKKNVARILAEEELQIKRDWFEGKRVLDAGCGNGRWSFGFAELGARITAVDFNSSAISETRKALEGFDVEKRFVVASLEDLPEVLGKEQFDLVFSWGVLHHVSKFNKSFRTLTSLVKPSGVFYTYLYGRESMDYATDVSVFKERVYYNSLATDEERIAFLKEKAGGDESRLHEQHDIWAPLINRRLEYDQISRLLEQLGFDDIQRTKAHTELFVRAIRGMGSRFNDEWVLDVPEPPYWFQRLGNS